MRDIINVNKGKKRKAQVTVFIILAIIIVAGIILFVLFKDSLFGVSVPKEIEPVYNYYLGCIEGEALLGSMIMGEQAGYIKPPDFTPGSVYMPFSNQLDFLGIGVPYWYYISGNGVVKEQVPSKGEMERQLGDFIEERAISCDFSGFVEQGFEIEVGKEIDVSSKIEKNKILVNVNQNLVIRTANVSWSSKIHLAEVDSSLGIFYDLSLKVYDHFKESVFLENYGKDILRLYAPVDGVDIDCSTKIWQLNDVRENLTSALEANIGFIKLKGDYYELRTDENKYFVQDIGEDVNANVNFLYSRNWPMRLEVWPSEDNLLIAEPIGLQEGLGMLGFCYVPYHFVYDFGYPVMIQMFYQGEIFQFPVVVYINKNQPREPFDTEGLPTPVPELCEHKLSEMTVYTYNKQLQPVEAKIEFKCLDTSCNIGKTSLDGRNSVLIANFPQCVNGYILASAEGYETSKYIISSINEGEASMFLDKKYNLELEVRKGGRTLSNKEYVVVSFIKDSSSRTISYPEQQRVDLTEGQYEIKVYIYSDVSLFLKGESTPKCVDIPKSGFLGAFGLTEEKCFNINIPDQNVEFAASGGGIQSHYITESELASFDKIIIDAEDFGVPNKIEDIQTNFNNIENSGLYVRFE
ncbi:MAG: hypothetical protein ABIH37_01145 [archaeon]